MIVVVVGERQARLVRRHVTRVLSATFLVGFLKPHTRVCQWHSQYPRICPGGQTRWMYPPKFSRKLIPRRQNP